MELTCDLPVTISHFKPAKTRKCLEEIEFHTRNIWNISSFFIFFFLFHKQQQEKHKECECGGGGDVMMHDVDERQRTKLNEGEGTC